MVKWFRELDRREMVVVSCVVAVIAIMIGNAMEDLYGERQEGEALEWLERIDAQVKWPPDAERVAEVKVQQLAAGLLTEEQADEVLATMSPVDVARAVAAVEFAELFGGGGAIQSAAEESRLARRYGGKAIGWNGRRSW